MLILCGDYIDYGPDNCKVLYKIKELIEKNPQQVVAIKGNHETMFLDFLFSKEQDFWNVEWLGMDKDFSATNSSISIFSKEKVIQLKKDYNYFDSF